MKSHITRLYTCPDPDCNWFRDIGSAVQSLTVWSASVIQHPLYGLVRNIDAANQDVERHQRAHVRQKASW